MVIDELDPNGEPDGEALVDDLGLEDDAAEVASPSLEDIAREKGWKPKEEWNGEGEWRDAAAFVQYGLDQSREVKRELKQVRETTAQIADTQARIMREAVDRAREEERARWNNIHRQAVEEGDFTAATQAAENLAKIQAPAAQQAPDPQVQRWVQENDWFQRDPAAMAVANAEASRLAQLGAGTAEQLEAAKKEVHKRFPEYAPKDGKAIEVGRPATTARPPRQGKTFHDLPAAAQQAARALVQRGILQNTEGYVKQYFNKEGTVE